MEFFEDIVYVPRSDHHQEAVLLVSEYSDYWQQFCLKVKATCFLIRSVIHSADLVNWLFLQENQVNLWDM